VGNLTGETVELFTEELICQLFLTAPETLGMDMLNESQFRELSVHAPFCFELTF